MRILLKPCKLSGEVTVPPSKSMAHRALICAAMADGESALSNIAPSQDILATEDALRQLGVRIEDKGDGCVRVAGIGGKRFPAPAKPVDCSESGSTLRFLIPIFSLTNAPVEFCGRGRLLARPQNVYADLFVKQGLRFEQTETEINLSGALKPGVYEVNGDVSSQFISGLLFALPLLNEKSTVKIRPPFESRSYVQLTQQAAADFGINFTWKDAYTIEIDGNQKYKSCDYTVEGDYSQGAFFAVLGAIKGGITIKGLRPDSLQGDKAVLEILQRCGAKISTACGGVLFEKSKLHATEIDLADCPDLGPILMVLGLFCEGETVIYNAGRLRMKESDRIAAMEQEAAKMGGRITSQGGTVRVQGTALHSAPDLDSHNDHRIAMAMAVAAMAADVPVAISDAQAINKSYPDFWRDLMALGAEVKQNETT